MSNKEKNIDAALESLEGIQRATPGPFFYTRVQARLQQEQKSSWQMIARLVTRPAIAITGLCLVVLINVLAIVNRSEVTASAQSADSSLAEEYTLASNSLYYYESETK